MATVATPIFCIPRGVDLDNMCFYSGPPDRKNPPKSRPRRRDEPFTDREWTRIDQLVDDVNETLLEPNQESKSEGVLTPTMKIAETLGLLYSDDKIDSENIAGSSFEWETDSLKHGNFPEDSGTERGSGSSNRPATATGSNPVNPVIIEDNQSSIDSEDDRSDTDSDGDLPSPERLTDRRRDLCPEENVTRADNQVVDSCMSSAVRVDDGGHSLPTVMDVVGAEMAPAVITHDATVPEENCGSGIDPSVDGASVSDTEHGDLPDCPDIVLESGGRASSPRPKLPGRADETEFGAPADSQTYSSDHYNPSAAVGTADSAPALEESCGNERKAPDQPLSKHNKRKRSQSADTHVSTVQTSDPTPEQPLQASHSVKRRRSLSTIRNDSVSHCISAAKPASSPVHNGTDPQVDNADDNNVSNEDGGGGDQNHLHVCNNERPERYPASDAGRDNVDEDSDCSSSEGDDDDDGDGDFNGDGNSEDEEGDSEDNGSLRRANRRMLSTDLLSSSDGAAITTSDIKCEVWPIRGFLKCKRIGSEEFFTLDFSPDNLRQHIPSPVNASESRRTATKPTALRMVADPPRITGQAGMPKSTPRPQKMKSKFTEEDDIRLIELKESQRLSWGEIKELFPGRSLGSLQVHYCTKLKDRATVRKKPRRL